MNRELNASMYALRQFIQKADAAFPGMPEVTITFPTVNAMARFRQQLRLDMTPSDSLSWADMPPGVEAEYSGIRIRLKVR